MLSTIFGFVAEHVMMIYKTSRFVIVFRFAVNVSNIGYRKNGLGYSTIFLMNISGYEVNVNMM